MTKRAYGSGSVRERRPGVWQIRVRVGADVLTGKPRVVTETFTGKAKDAQRRLAQLVAEHEGQPSTSATVGDAIAAWRAAALHEAGTRRNYDLAGATIPAGFRSVELGKLRAATVRQLVGAVELEHGPHRARLVHAVISGACTYAHTHEWIRSNPARLVTPPAAPRRRDTAPDTPAVVRLLAAVDDDPRLAAWLWLAVDTGCRRSEVLALRWSDVDLEAGSVLVDDALDPVTGRSKALKSGSDRNVAITPATVAVLRRWQTAARQRALAVGGRLAPSAFVLSLDPLGRTPWRPDYGTKRFAKIRESAGIASSIRLHDLRHHMATTLLAAGVDVKTVSARAGHTRTATTADLYAAAVPANDRAAATVLGDALRAAGGRQ